MYLTKKNNFQHSSTNTLHHVFSCFGEYSKLHVITFYAQTTLFILNSMLLTYIMS